MILNIKLKKAREESGLTQVQVANKAKISVISYQRIEYGQQTPRLSTAILIAQVLNSTVEDLF